MCSKSKLCPHPRPKLILIDVDYHNFNNNQHVLVENIPDRKMLIIVDELLSAWSIVIYQAMIIIMHHLNDIENVSRLTSGLSQDNHHALL